MIRNIVYLTNDRVRYKNQFRILVNMEYTEKEINAVKYACYISGFIAPLLSTMMNLSLVNIGEEFGTGSHDLAYVNSAFLLTSVIFMVPLAKLQDIIGKKKLFVIGLLIICMGCIIGSLAPSFWFVVIARSIIGIGASALAVVSVAILTDVIPLNKRGATMGLQIMFIYIGLALGPALGGTLNDLIGWRLLFLIVIPMAIISIIIMLRGFKGEIANDKGGIFDFKGSVVYGMAILLSMAGVMNMPQTWAFASLVAGLLFLVLFIWMQLHNEHCLLEIRLFRIKVFSGSCIATFMSYAASYSMSFFMALYLQSIGGLTATEAGLFMIIQPVIQCICSPFWGRMTDKIQNKTILPTVGMAITGVGVLSVAFYDIDTPFYFIVMTMVCVGAGFAMFSAPNTFLIMSSVPKEYTGEASGVMAVMRQTGMMVSMGIAMLYISLIMGSTDNLSEDTYDLFTEVLWYSFITCFIMCVIGALTSAFRGAPKNC